MNLEIISRIICGKNIIIQFKRKIIIRFSVDYLKKKIHCNFKLIENNLYTIIKRKKNLNEPYEKTRARFRITKKEIKSI